MDKFLTFTGQQPVYLGDIDFMQSAVAACFTDLAMTLMGADSNSLNGILQGVQIVYDSGMIEWTKGIVVLNGEILPIESGSLPGDVLTNLYLHLVAEQSGERTFKNGVTRSCWETRKATITTSSSGGVLVSTLPRYFVPAYYEDAVYNGEPDVSSITEARLIRRSGLWFCDVTIAGLTSSMSYQGVITFSSLPAEQIDQLALKSFCIALIIEEGTYRGISICDVSFSRNQNSLEMNISFEYNRHGEGETWSTKIQTLIPVF